ncbi:MAG: biotin carboxylase N-terminal domain-containing protein [bacterium]|nr:biotin carboxylase N-terminal domain-containing protein [bacterium]
MIRKLLIANRGEIACRISRTCRELGIATVAVYSDADTNALHVEMADEAVHLGASPASESYLNSEKIIVAAKRTGADAIHPGYGFLSENPDFAQAVIDTGLTWIGPPVNAIRAMGKKRESKLILKDIPLVPGYEGEDQSDAVLIEAAAQIGFPVMVKASAGGGGKGMRRVDAADDLPEALAAARREAKQAFGDDTLILEKYVVNPRHIEIQIFGDAHGNVIALGERECSIQRRHQKIIEETPSPALDDALRQRICDVAVSIGQQLGYISAGTVEFLLDSDRNFFFMEMNTRLQVEHPVTEQVWQADLVAWQIAVAEGQTLEQLGALNAQPRGHSIEVRLYAEDPANDFLPVTGDILHFQLPETTTSASVRVDTGIRSGDSVSVFYDPMLAKIISHSPFSREDAIRRLDDALSRLHLLGLRNNLPFLRRLLHHPAFIAGNLHTHFIDQYREELREEAADPTAALIAAALAKTRRGSPTNGTVPVGHWRNSPNRPLQHSFVVGEKHYRTEITPKQNQQYDVRIAQVSASHNEPDEHIFDVRVLQESDVQMALVVDGHRQQATVVEHGDIWWVQIGGNSTRLDWQTPLPLPNRTAKTEGSLRAPMTGQIMSIRIEVGQSVSQGDILATLEAMKMEHRVQAPYDGVVGAIHHQVGETVQADTVLLEIHRSDSA